MLKYKDMENNNIMNSKNLKDYQKEIVDIIRRYAEINDINLTTDYALKKLCEEVGEFSQALLISENQVNKKKIKPAEENKAELANELVDVLSMAFLNAELHDIDLTEAIERKNASNREKNK